MKKSNLLTGLIYFLLGIIFLAAAVSFESKLESLLFGFAGAGISSGAVMLWKYYYWTRPKNQARYQEKIQNETIELEDERKTMLRDKAGRYAYIVGLVVISVSVVIFSVMGNLELLKDFQLIVIYLTGLFIFLYVIGIVIYRFLSKKY